MSRLPSTLNFLQQDQEHQTNIVAAPCLENVMKREKKKKKSLLFMFVCASIGKHYQVSSLSQNILKLILRKSNL